MFLHLQYARKDTVEEPSNQIYKHLAHIDTEILLAVQKTKVSGSGKIEDKLVVWKLIRNH